MSDTTQLEYLAVDELDFAELRDIRQNVVEQIKDRIKDSGYNPTRPLRVVESGETYTVIDGNHRLKAITELGETSELPCVVESGVDIHKLAIESNRDEDTYAEMDLFDYLDMVDALRKKHTQEEIGDKIGWSRSKVAQYISLLENTVTETRNTARNHQTGRVTENVTSVTDFTEGWFRNSGLYELMRDGVDEYALPTEDEEKTAQMRVMEWFVNERNCDATKSKMQEKCERVLSKCNQLETLQSEVSAGVSNDKLCELRESVLRGEHTDSTLCEAIEKVNKGAKDRAEFGVNCVEGLKSVEDNSVACVVTDPPYGVEYESHRNPDRPDFSDGHEETLLLLDDVFSELTRVCKENAHVYIFAPWDSGIPELAAEYFDVAAYPLIWCKNNHVPTRDRQSGFRKMYAPKYQMIFVCRMPKGDNRMISDGDTVKTNVFNYARPTDKYHTTQKPIGLLSDLLTNSTATGETVLDPFAGSGSTLLASAQNGRHYIGFEKETEYESRFKRELNEVKS